MDINESLKLLCENSNDLYFLIEINNDTLVYSNPAFQNVFKAAGGSSKLLSCVHPEDRQYVFQNYHACKSWGAVDDFECRIILDGTQFYYKISASLIRSSSGESVIGCTAEEITDLKEYMNNVNAHNKKKNSILNIVSHDLMGPIGIIESISNLMGDETEPTDEQQLRQYIQLINKTSKKCISLIRNFINQEFLESVGVSLVKQRVELVSLMGALMDEYKNSGTDLKKNFTFQSSAEKIYGAIDSNKFFQTINNLISNSLKFTPEGGTIALSITEQESTLLISVADDGIGIPEEFHKNLFEKFSSAGRTGLNGEESIGLGMSIIHTIVEWHSGKIWFDSKENQGTTFYIEIPK